MALDPANYENPHSQIVTAEYLYYLNPGSVQMLTQSLKRVNVFNYEGLIPTWNKFFTYSELGTIFTTSSYRDPSKIQCTAEEAAATVENSCRSYFEFNIQASGQSVSVKRRYKTMTETFGEIGGVKEVIIIVIGSFYAFFHAKYFDQAMISKIYSGVDDLAPSDAKRPAKQLPQSCCTRVWTSIKSWFKSRSEPEEFAAHSILESLDVIRIIAELNKLHVLVNFLMPDSVLEDVPKLALLLRRLRLREALAVTSKVKREKLRLRNSKCINTLKEDLQHFRLKVITREYLLRSQDKMILEATELSSNHPSKFELAKSEEVHNQSFNKSSLHLNPRNSDHEVTKTQKIRQLLFKHMRNGNLKRVLESQRVQKKNATSLHTTLEPHNDNKAPRTLAPQNTPDGEQWEVYDLERSPSKEAQLTSRKCSAENQNPPSSAKIVRRSISRVTPQSGTQRSWHAASDPLNKPQEP